MTGSLKMSDINNNGSNQYDHSMIPSAEDTESFLQLIYRNIKSRDKREQMIKLYFGGEHDNNIGDC